MNYSKMMILVGKLVYPRRQIDEYSSSGCLGDPLQRTEISNVTRTAVQA